MRKRRWLWVVIALVVVAGLVGGFFLWRRSSATANAAGVRMTAVQRDVLQVTVSASGSLEPIRQINLSFEVAGKVAEVLVDIGDTVKAGQVLARLDTSDLELSVRQAELALKSAQVQLDSLKSPTTEEIKSAEAAYYSALAQYQSLKNSPSEETLTAAKIQLEQARIALEQARAAYDRVSWRPDIGALPQSQQLQEATLNYELVLAQYNEAIKGPSQAELAAAWRNVESAKAKLDSLKSGPTAAELTSAEVAVEQAQINLDTARRNLERAVLKAPFDGIVAAMNLVVGEEAVSPAITLIDPSRFRITVNVDEMDVGQLTPGMPVDVTVDALPDVQLTGTVERIGVAASSTGGAVYYPVVITLDSTDAPLRADMSANVSIRVQELTDQLLIPTWAILTDPVTSRPYVIRRTVSGEERVNIQVGTRYGGYAQVLSGLSEGDVLIVPNAGSTSTSTGFGAMRFLFGGPTGGMPPGEIPRGERPPSAPSGGTGGSSSP